MILKKRLTALLLLIILTITVAGCENVEYITKSEAGEEESKNIYEQLDEDLPDLTPGEDGEVIEQSFVIATNKASVFYNEEGAASSISRAVEDRTVFLKDKYGANVTVKEVSSKDLTNELKTAIESGIPYCDMICVSAKDTVKLYTAGLLGDMNKLPSFDIESAYFDPNNAKALATNSTLYMLADPTAQVYEETYVMFFNRDLVNTAAGKDPESLVMQGKWTWDAFNETARAAAPKVYNKSASDILVDTFGYASYYSEGTFPLVMWNSCGLHLVDNTYKNPVSLSMTVDEITSYASKLKSSYNSRGRFPLEGADAAKAFEEGRLAFFCNKLDYFYALRDGTTLGSNYGMLPMPKYDENQKDYHCMVGSDARVFSIPKSVENADESRKMFVSAVIQATCASGRTTIKKAFLNHHIATYLNNNAETVMLQTILDSVYFDFATVYGSNISAIRRATTTAVSDYIEFGSGLSNSIASAKPNFEKYCSDNFS